MFEVAKRGNENAVFFGYLNEIPANPLTGVATITETEETPPKHASGTGGWLYHQATGRIFIDAPELLNK